MRRVARGDRHLVRLGRDAVRAVALPLRARGGVHGALPGRLHLRGRGPDARLVLLAAGDRDERCSTARPYRQRGRERAGARRRRPEDVEDRGQRRRSVGGDPRLRRRHGAALPAGLEPGVAAPSGSTRRRSRRVAGGFLNTLRNTYTFFAALRRRLDAGGAATATHRGRSLDRWLLARLDATGRGSHDGVGELRRHGRCARRSSTSSSTTCPTGTCG